MAHGFYLAYKINERILRRPRAPGRWWATTATLAEPGGPFSRRRTAAIDREVGRGGTDRGAAGPRARAAARPTPRWDVALRRGIGGLA